MNSFRLFRVCTLIAIATHVVRADTIFGTNLESPTMQDLFVDQFDMVTQAFTLNEPFQVNQITVGLTASDAATVTFWITNSQGPGTTLSNVLFQTNSTFPIVSFPDGQPVSVTADVLLQPGTYYLMLTSGGPFTQQGWDVTNGDLANTIGSVGSDFVNPGPLDSSFPPASSLTSLSTAMEFQLSGTLADVPEPGTLGLVFAGAAILLMLKLRGFRSTKSST